MELIIGFSFKENSLHYQKIENFRKRFDSKYSHFNDLTLVIIPTFTIDFKNREDEKKFIEDINEIIEGQFFGIDELSDLEFNGISFTVGKKRFLGLTPIVSPDVVYCQEALSSYLKENGVTFKKSKSALNPILAIGRFETDIELATGIEAAKVEFPDPFTVEVESVSLYYKSSNGWHLKKNLFNF